MELLQEINAAVDGLSTSEMLRFLLEKQFPGEVVVTASLKAPSIVTLKLISEIEPSTPVIFCQPMPEFSESRNYRSEILERLGLTNSTVKTKSDPMASRGAHEFREFLWNERRGGGGSRENIHLHDVLSPYKCWIKAAYHDLRETSTRVQIGHYAGKVIVDPLYNGLSESVSELMKIHGLPYHPKIRRRSKRLPPPDGPVTGFQFG